MKVIPIQAKKLLSHVKQPDDWFGLKYNMNLYRGCQHQCIYCDTRSECYQVKNFSTEIRYKENFAELLRQELAAKRVHGTIGLGSMNDPYMPLEKQLSLTRKALMIIAEFQFPVHIITKSDLILRDLKILEKIARVYLTVSFSITTCEDRLARKIEPYAPLPSARWHALNILRQHKIQAGVLMMPLLPFIEDDRANIIGIVKNTAKNNGSYILPAFGMTLRDRQREYFFNKLDQLFPDIRPKYEAQFGNSYGCSVPRAKSLKKLFNSQCESFDLPRRIPFYQKNKVEQLTLFF